jgi:thermitase
MIANIYLFAALLALTTPDGQVSISSIDAISYHPHRVIMKFNDSAPLYAEVKAIFESSDVDAVRNESLTQSEALNNFMRETHLTEFLPLSGSSSIKTTPQGLERIFIGRIPDNMPIEYIVSLLHDHPAIEYAEPDYLGYGGGAPCNEHDDKFNSSSQNIIPNDFYFSNQWGLKNEGQSIGGVAGIAGADINIVDVWDITTGSAEIVIAVLDSGIPKSHPEFAGRLIQGYDFVNSDNDPEDDHGHGTSVASIAAATGNNSGLMAGVDWNATIMPVKILDHENSGFYSWWIGGIEYAVNNGANVLNLSVGGSGYSQALHDAVNYALDNGVIVVACMMNENNDVTFYPAGFDGVISIGAINNRDERAVPFCWGGGSNYGNHIDFAAPGERITSLRYQDFNSTGYWCGTSQATPMVAGTITLMLSLDPTLTRDDVFEILKLTTRSQVHLPAKQISGWDQDYGWGRIDAYAAVEEVLRMTSVSGPYTNDAQVNEFRLFQNYPNPFNPSTMIRYDIPVESNVLIEVCNMLGQRVTVLIDEFQQAGYYTMQFNAENLPSGVYLYRITAGEYTVGKKLMLLR